MNQNATLEATEQLLRTASEAGTGHALPATCYTDPGFFALEREHVLRPGWHAVARRDELPNPGDYRTLDVCGERVLLVRGEDRQLRALSAICLHRASPIADAGGNTKRFVCPYHRWAYDLEGRLKAAPLMEDVPGFDRDACRLPELRLEVWQGFVVVNLDGDAAPLGAQLTALDALLEPVGLGQAVHVGVSDWDSPWNWKVMVENFIESYHHLGPHAANLGKSNPARGTHELALDGPCAVLENPGVEGAPPFWVVQVFPTLLLAQVRGELPIAYWYEMQIDRHDHLHLRIHSLVPEAFADNSEVVELAQTSVSEIHLEDIPVCEGIQRGLQSRLWQPGRLSTHEACIRRFHRFLADAMSHRIADPGRARVAPAS